MRKLLGAVAIELNVGADSIIKKLIEAGFESVADNINYQVTEEQYQFLKGHFAEDFLLKQKMESLKRTHLKINIKEVAPLIKEFQLLNIKIRTITNNMGGNWKYREIESFIQEYKNRLPSEIVAELIEEDVQFKDVLMDTVIERPTRASAITREEIEIEPDPVNWEAVIMAALENGTADQFGF